MHILTNCIYFWKAHIGEYILKKIFSTSEVGPILALIAPSPLVEYTLFFRVTDRYVLTS